MTLKTTAQVEQALRKISSDNTEEHREGWREIHDHSAGFRKSLNDAQMLYLLNLSFTEGDSATFRLALKAMLALAMFPAGVIARSERPTWPEGSLEQNVPEALELLPHWLWKPFYQPSAVLAVTATNFRRRDEDALLWLGRRLSFAKYPHTEFPHIALENPDLAGVLFSQRYQTFCIVGRLGLFGQKALEQFGNDDLRFGFDVHCRPEGRAPNELDKRYHCVFERVEDGKRRFHRTKEEDGIRTDFAVVQRYQVELGTQHVVVVIVAGASSLGTAAGARWAAYDLFQPTDTIDSRPIEVPPRITPRSRMEALLCVRAKVTTRAWDHPEIELRKLSVDGVSWSLKDQKWHEAPIRLITVIREGGQPTQILFDGQPSRLERGKQMFRLMVALVEQKQRSGDAELDISALVANDEIWEKPNPTEKYVRAQLRLLRTRYLQEALDMRGTLKLRAKVNVINKP